MPIAEITTPLAVRATPVADQMFDAVFQQSSDFRIKMDFESALQFIERIGAWNDFEPAVVIEELENVDRRIPRRFYGAGNPNNGQRDFTISVGREGSPVIYLERHEFGLTPDSQLSDSDIRVICDIMQYMAQADEAHADVEELSSGFCRRKITFRFWWD